MSDLFHFPTFDEQYPNLRERGIRKYAVVYLRDHIQRLLARPPAPCWILMPTTASTRTRDCKR